MGPTNTDSAVMDALIEDFARGIRSGATLSDIEAAVIEPAPLDGDHKAALWIYAWSSHRPARRRIRAHLGLGPERRPDCVSELSPASARHDGHVLALRRGRERLVCVRPWERDRGRPPDRAERGCRRI